MVLMLLRAPLQIDNDVLISSKSLSVGHSIANARAAARRIRSMGLAACAPTSDRSCSSAMLEIGPVIAEHVNRPSKINSGYTAGQEGTGRVR